MSFDELKETLRAAKLLPIHVEGSPLDDRQREFTFIGSLTEYIEAVAAFGTPYVLVFTEVLNEDRFLYTGDESMESPESPDEVDLCAIRPPLRRFKNKIGEIAMFKLSATREEDRLAFFINEDWWLEFIKLWGEATDQVESDRATAVALFRENRESESRQLLDALSALIHDERFVSLPTQRAMIAYATDLIPALSTLDDSVLRAEIQTLHAKIKAKGLGGKR